MLNLKVIEQEAPTEIKKDMPALVERCTPLKGEDSCETAFKQTKCFVNEMKELEKVFAARLLEEQEKIVKSAEAMRKAAEEKQKPTQ